MSRLDRFPSTPVKLITGWVTFCGLFVFSLVAMWAGKTLVAEIFITVWTAVLAYNGIAFAQFWAKRSTAWEPPAPVTKSEATQPAGSGQPAVAVAPARKAPIDTLGEEGP